jgi:hypothetical protein
MKGVEEGRWHLDRPLGDHLKMLKDRPKVTIAASSEPFRRISRPPQVLRRPAGQDPAGRRPPPWSSKGRRRAAGLRAGQSSRSIRIWASSCSAPSSSKPCPNAWMSWRSACFSGRCGFQHGLRGLAQPSAPAAQFRGHEVAPTERCPVRGRLIVGEVHDLNAFAMGGIAGHAGLFGGAQDLLQNLLLPCALPTTAGRARRAPFVRPRCCANSGSRPGSLARLGASAGTARPPRVAGGRPDFPARGRAPFLHRLLAVDRSRARNLRGRAVQSHPSRGARRPALSRASPALHDAALQAIGYQAG